MITSVIISTYTEERYNDVLKCIRLLREQTHKPDEIILVLDPVDELIDFYSGVVPECVKIVASDGFGLSNARNSGVKIAKGDVIAFIDDDAWPDHRWLENMIKNYRDKKVWGVGGKIVPVFDECRPRWLPEELDWVVGCTYKGMPERRSEVRNPIGANMSFRKEAFEVAGLFRTEVGRYGKKLLSGEEAEFAMRLKKLIPSAKIVYDPEVVVYHRVPRNRARLKYVLKRGYYEGYSKALLAREYPLKGEYNYLRYLIFKSIPDKVRRASFLELTGLLVVVLMVVVGNIVGRTIR